MKQEIQVTLLQEEQQSSEQTPVAGLLPLYQTPEVIIYGTVTQLTKGSGGDYDDECTSGKQPGDDA